MVLRPNDMVSAVLSGDSGRAGAVRTVREVCQGGGSAARPRQRARRRGRRVGNGTTRTGGRGAAPCSARCDGGCCILGNTAWSRCPSIVRSPTAVRLSVNRPPPFIVHSFAPRCSLSSVHCLVVRPSVNRWPAVVRGITTCCRLCHCSRWMAGHTQCGW
jgi:hypothetical protein